MKPSSHILNCRQSFGARVREIREEQELTQRELGLTAGLERSNISRIESGQGATSLDVLIAIANGFGMSPSELLRGIGEPINPEQPPPSWL